MISLREIAKLWTNGDFASVPSISNARIAKQNVCPHTYQVHYRREQNNEQI